MDLIQLTFSRGLSIVMVVDFFSKILRMTRLVDPNVIYSMRKLSEFEIQGVVKWKYVGINQMEGAAKLEKLVILLIRILSWNFGCS